MNSPVLPRRGPYRKEPSLKSTRKSAFATTDRDVVLAVRQARERLADLVRQPPAPLDDVPLASELRPRHAGQAS